MRRVVLAVVLVLAAVGGVAHATATPNDTNGSDLTLSELRNGGTQYDNAPASVRQGEALMFWVVHWPAGNLMANPGEDGNWAYLQPGATVERNAVYLKTIKPSPDPQQVTVTVAYWNRGTKTVQRANGTVTKPVAENVTVATHEVTLQQGWPQKQIDLRRHDERTQVTMWLAECPDSCRWTFEHHSVATTQPAHIQSWGDYIWRLVTDVLIWIGAGGFVAGGITKRALDRAGRGPGWGYGLWIVVLTVVTGLAIMVFYSSLANLIVKIPTILAAYMVGLFLVVLLETYTSNVVDGLFIRPDIEAAISPSGEDAVDMVQADIVEEQLVRMPDGSKAVVKQGLFPFLARAFGGAARLENAKEIKTTVRLPDSKWDELYFVHPDADEVLDYEPEGWTTNFPDIDDRSDLLGLAVPAVFTLAVGAVAFQTFGTAGALLSVGTMVGIMVVRPEDGHARLEPAPGHMRSAFAQMMMLTEETEDAETIDEAREQLRRERVRSQQDVEQAVEDMDQTLIEEMHGLDLDRELVPEDEAEAVIQQVEDGDLTREEAVERLTDGRADEVVGDD